VTAPKLDLSRPPESFTLPSGFPWISSKDERTINPALGFTQGGWDAVYEYAEALRRGWCEMWLTLQRANGDEPDLPALCAPPMADPPPPVAPATPNFSHPRSYPMGGFNPNKLNLRNQPNADDRDEYINTTYHDDE
jgi:hypothetical protein